MADLCTTADVEALSGAPVTEADQPRVDRLIEMASALVGNVTGELPDPVPAEVAMVTANLVVRQMANPTGLVSEGIAGYSAAYGAGMALTDADLAALGPWLRPDLAGKGVVSVPLTRTSAWWPYDWWQRDLDNLDVTVTP